MHTHTHMTFTFCHGQDCHSENIKITSCVEFTAVVLQKWRHESVKKLHNHPEYVTLAMG